MTKVNEILFDIDNYLDEETFTDEARDLMVKDISREIQLLINNGYVAVIRPFERDIVQIQFDKDSRLSNSPMWVTQEEKSNIIKTRVDADNWSLKLP